LMYFQGLYATHICTIKIYVGPAKEEFGIYGAIGVCIFPLDPF